MVRGGLRPGAGRPRGTTKADGMTTKVVRVSSEITKEQCDNIPQMIDVINHWEDKMLADITNPRYYYLQKMIEEIRVLGY